MRSAPLSFAELRFVLTPDQSAKFDKVFEAHAEVGAISGQKVRELLMKSELPKEELSTVWGLCKSERNQSPNLNRNLNRNRNQSPNLNRNLNLNLNLNRNRNLSLSQSPRDQIGQLIPTI